MEFAMDSSEIAHSSEIPAQNEGVDGINNCKQQAYPAVAASARQSKIELFPLSSPRKTSESPLQARVTQEKHEKAEGRAQEKAAEDKSAMDVEGISGKKISRKALARQTRKEREEKAHSKRKVKRAVKRKDRRGDHWSPGVETSAVQQSDTDSTPNNEASKDQKTLRLTANQLRLKSRRKARQDRSQQGKKSLKPLLGSNNGNARASADSARTKTQTRLKDLIRIRLSQLGEEYMPSYRNKLIREDEDKNISKKWTAEMVVVIKKLDVKETFSAEDTKRTTLSQKLYAQVWAFLNQRRFQDVIDANALDWAMDRIGEMKF